jgi:hypothetical protein
MHDMSRVWVHIVAPVSTHASTVQASLSSQLTGVPPRQPVSEHISTPLQRMRSSQSALVEHARAATQPMPAKQVCPVGQRAFCGTNTQVFITLHWFSVQSMRSSQSVGARHMPGGVTMPEVHPLAGSQVCPLGHISFCGVLRQSMSTEHESRVQAMLSLQSAGARHVRGATVPPSGQPLETYSHTPPTAQTSVVQARPSSQSVELRHVRGADASAQPLEMCWHAPPTEQTSVVQATPSSQSAAL